MSEKSYALSELTAHLNEVIKVNFEKPLWIRAEISEFRENANGHCYLEFIEKDATTDALLAKIKATIWTNTYRMLKPYFENSTGQVLHAGLSVLVAVTVDFHDIYGLSLNVRDIDPTFTLGALAARRLEIIRQLETDGVMEMNKSLAIPVLPQRIAVISSASAAGYDDFCNQLTDNPDRFVFYKQLFPAIMQGEMAPESIIEALDKIFAHMELFDVVVIIRGGGATTDMACFDNYDLAFNCAQFPLPIIAGIGHQRDLSIVDMVAHTSVKTPTAAAELLVELMSTAKDTMTDTYTSIHQLLRRKVQQEQELMTTTRWKIRHALQNKTAIKKLQLEQYKSRLSNSLKLIVNNQHNKLTLLIKNIERHSPAFLLQHGYSITTLNGKRLTSAKAIKPGDKVTTYLSDGNFKSTVD